MTASSPIIGVTADLANGRVQVGEGYARMIAVAGGTPIILPPLLDQIDALLALCDGVVLSGGDDPDMAQWGVPMHPKATPLNPQRQAFELALLAALDRDDSVPALGVCLGMQLMGLHHGGTLDQYLPETLPSAPLHWDQGSHEVTGEIGWGIVHSHHRQALREAGEARGMVVIGSAPDGVIEAIALPKRAAMYLGVQWHPERTADEHLGLGMFRKLVDAASVRRTSRKSR